MFTLKIDIERSRLKLSEKIFIVVTKKKKNCGAARPHRVGAKKKRERDMQA
jgi:hypothetical protein